MSVASESKPPTPELCGVCGEEVSCCPVCHGDGEVPDFDERGYRHRNRLEDPPDIFVTTRHCDHCGGDGRHVCIAHPCDGCREPAQIFDVTEDVHLCLRCKTAP